MVALKSIRFKKVRGSSLIETLIATIMILFVFGIALTTITNTLERTVKSNTRFVDHELNRLEYMYRNSQLQVPDQIDIKDWQIDIKREKENDLNFIVFAAKNKTNSKEKKRRILE